jgi:hypothetical protein
MVVDYSLSINILERFDFLSSHALKFNGDGLSTIWIGPVSLIDVSEPRLVIKILTSEKCLTKSEIIYANVPFSEGLFTVNDSEFFINILI